VKKYVSNILISDEKLIEYANEYKSLQEQFDKNTILSNLASKYRVSKAALRINLFGGRLDRIDKSLSNSIKK